MTYTAAQIIAKLIAFGADAVNATRWTNALPGGGPWTAAQIFATLNEQGTPYTAQDCLRMFP